MKPEKKLIVFSRVALGEAESKAAEFISRLNEEAEAKAEEAKRSAKVEAEEEVRKERNKAEQNIKKEVFSAELKKKKAMFDLKEKLAEKLFDDVIKMLREYVRGSEYAEKLKDDIRATALEFPNDKIKIYISCGSRVETYSNVEYVESDEDFIGGFKAVVEGKGILIDKSLRNRLENARSDFAGIRLNS